MNDGEDSSSGSLPQFEIPKVNSDVVLKQDLCGMYHVINELQPNEEDRKLFEMMMKSKGHDINALLEDSELSVQGENELEEDPNFNKKDPEEALRLRYMKARLPWSECGHEVTARLMGPMKFGDSIDLVTLIEPYTMTMNQYPETDESTHYKVKKTLFARKKPKYDKVTRCIGIGVTPDIAKRPFGGLGDTMSHVYFIFRFAFNKVYEGDRSFMLPKCRTETFALSSKMMTNYIKDAIERKTRRIRAARILPQEYEGVTGAALGSGKRSTTSDHPTGWIRVPIQWKRHGKYGESLARKKELENKYPLFADGYTYLPITLTINMLEEKDQKKWEKHCAQRKEREDRIQKEKADAERERINREENAKKKKQQSLDNTAKKHFGPDNTATIKKKIDSVAENVANSVAKDKVAKEKQERDKKVFQEYMKWLTLFKETREKIVKDESAETRSENCDFFSTLTNYATIIKSSIKFLRFVDKTLDVDPLSEELPDEDSPLSTGGMNLMRVTADVILVRTFLKLTVEKLEVYYDSPENVRLGDVRDPESDDKKQRTFWEHTESDMPAALSLLSTFTLGRSHPKHKPDKDDTEAKEPIFETAIKDIRLVAKNEGNRRRRNFHRRQNEKKKREAAKKKAEEQEARLPTKLNFDHLPPDDPRRKIRSPAEVQRCYVEELSAVGRRNKKLKETKIPATSDEKKEAKKEKQELSKNIKEDINKMADKERTVQNVRRRRTNKKDTLISEEFTLAQQRYEEAIALYRECLEEATEVKKMLQEPMGDTSDIGIVNFKRTQYRAEEFLKEMIKYEDFIKSLESGNKLPEDAVQTLRSMMSFVEKTRVSFKDLPELPHPDMTKYQATFGDVPELPCQIKSFPRQKLNPLEKKMSDAERRNYTIAALQHVVQSTQPRSPFIELETQLRKPKFVEELRETLTLAFRIIMHLIPNPKFFADFKKKQAELEREARKKRHAEEVIRREKEEIKNNKKKNKAKAKDKQSSSSTGGGASAEDDGFGDDDFDDVDDAPGLFDSPFPRFGYLDTNSRHFQNAAWMIHELFGSDICLEKTSFHRRGEDFRKSGFIRYDSVRRSEKRKVEKTKDFFELVAATESYHRCDAAFLDYLQAQAELDRKASELPPITDPKEIALDEAHWRLMQRYEVRMEAKRQAWKKKLKNKEARMKKSLLEYAKTCKETTPSAITSSFHRNHARKLFSRVPEGPRKETLLEMYVQSTNFEMNHKKKLSKQRHRRKKLLGEYTDSDEEETNLSSSDEKTNGADDGDSSDSAESTIGLPPEPYESDQRFVEEVQFSGIGPSERRKRLKFTPPAMTQAKREELKVYQEKRRARNRAQRKEAKRIEDIKKSIIARQKLHLRDQEWEASGRTEEDALKSENDHSRTKLNGKKKASASSSANKGRRRAPAKSGSKSASAAAKAKREALEKRKKERELQEEKLDYSSDMSREESEEDDDDNGEEKSNVEEKDPVDVQMDTEKGKESNDDNDNDIQNDVQSIESIDDEDEGGNIEGDTKATNENASESSASSLANCIQSPPPKTTTDINSNKEGAGDESVSDISDED